jgi:hypothetical protein
MRKVELPMPDLLSNAVLFSAVALVIVSLMLGDKLVFVAGDLLRTGAIGLQSFNDFLLSLLR